MCCIVRNGCNSQLHLSPSLPPFAVHLTPYPPPVHNRFPAVALSWAAALLRECDRPHHGIDLFGRDYFLLGRMLVTLGESA